MLALSHHARWPAPLLCASCALQALHLREVFCNSCLSARLCVQIQGLPTLVFISMDKDKPALRLEGLLPASAIKDVLADLTSSKVPT